ncbi:hypothetical protein DOTSEDRAFT_67832 [Dothistroma septosporum NZE10]|uniref:Uncharacterized protein n=1 Tax=Dothistroma septosporum (strain NZE10 / CBS 128990) TaxID=675120 RepID=N1Q2M3_DOTSN|nr:hypothetical protein DOTSEDRAFT_67832 [Dothistroma septosporum NZE10]
MRLARALIWCWHNPKCQEHEDNNGVSCSGERSLDRNDRNKASESPQYVHTVGEACICWSSKLWDGRLRSG